MLFRRLGPPRVRLRERRRRLSDAALIAALLCSITLLCAAAKPEVTYTLPSPELSQLGDDSERVAPCPSPGLDTGTWVRVEQKHFTFSLPPDFVEEHVQAIDSWVRSFRAADSTVVLTFDWGWYSDPLTPPFGEFDSFEACREGIGGRGARIVTMFRQVPRASHTETSFRYGAGAAWRDVEPKVHLTLFGAARERKGLYQLLQIYRTVRFE